MGIVATIATVVLIISFVVFVSLFGRLPIFRRTPIAWLHRLLLVHLPNGILAVDQRLSSGRFTSSLLRFGNYMAHDKHPTVLIFFVLLLSVSEYLAIPSAWPMLSAAQHVCLVLLVAMPYLFLYLAAFSDPGIVSLGNLRHHLLQYPYDYALFFPGARCRTCNLLKPPRSKHCSVCKHCIARLDHHCIFINNCVGAGNQHWFLLLLLTTAMLASYGGLVGMGLIAARVRTRYPAWSLLPWLARLSRAAESSETGAGAGTGKMTLQEWLVAWSWGMRDHARLGSVSLLGLLLCPLVWGLLAYNLWNIWTGQTTNESLKWADWKEDMAYGLVYRRQLHGDWGVQPDEHQHLYSPNSPSSPNFQNSPSFIPNLPHSPNLQHLQHRLPDSNNISSSNSSNSSSSSSSSYPYATSSSAFSAVSPTLSRWPVSPAHVLMCTDNGQPPPTDDPHIPGVGPWEKVWRLRDVDNIYDLGFWRNLTDIFVPSQRFLSQSLPSVEVRGRTRKRAARR